jgi:hypothetical protein
MNSGFLQNGSTTRTRQLPGSAVWTPLPYMRRAVDFLKTHYSGGLPLKPGGRKTSITLKAFSELRDEGKAKTMLVIAPLRVCRQVWRQEGTKWADFNHLTFALVHGGAKKRKEALASGADVYLVNPEGVEWLCSLYMGRRLPFDIVAIDELTKFQNAQANRHKALKPRLANVPYRWGLTGSLFAKGHMGIFGQQLILDDGAALGRFITHYRDQFFQVAYNGFDYELLPGAERRIVERLAPYWMHVDASDYAQLPAVLDVPRRAQMDKEQAKIYRGMRDDMVAKLPEGVITASNAGACYAKLAQMANGAVYIDTDRGREYVKLHDLKLDMLEELVDELDGEPLFVGYEFNADLDRLRERFGKDTPFLGKGTTSKQEEEWVAAWNRGELPLMFAHPQSTAHGLNLQEGQACNVAWFSITWDWELYDQFIRRVRRSGNMAAQVFNHLLIIDGTLDETKLAAITDKDLTERRLVTALTNEILRETQGATKENTEMVAKLSRPGDSAGQATGSQGKDWGRQVEEARPQERQGNGNGAATGWGAAAGPDQNADQRQRIQEEIAPRDRTEQARGSFSGGVSEAASRIEGGDYGQTTANGWGKPQDERPREGDRGPSEHDKQQAGGWGGQQAGNTTAAEPEKAKRTRTAKPKEDGPAPSDVAENLAILSARATVVAAVTMSSPDSSVEEIVDAARSIMEFVERG